MVVYISWLENLWCKWVSGKNIYIVGKSFYKRKKRKKERKRKGGSLFFIFFF